MSETERRTYLNHIRRLQERNLILGQMLAQERIAKQHAYAWYYKRLRSRFWSLMDLMLLRAGKAGVLVLAAFHLKAFKK
jgi:hypothetical protein